MYPDSRDEVVELYLDDIIPNRFQPREVFDERALKELAVSIKEHGVIQPIIVRNVNGKYEIIAGERRYKASALAGLTKIPAIIRDLDDKESSKVALLENLQRKNLNPIEEARTYQKILEIDEMTQEELAKTMGKSQSAVANKIRLLSLPDEIQDALLKEQISERHARTLLNIPDAEKQKEMLKKIIDTKMSVRTLEEEINNLYPKTEQTKEEVKVPTVEKQEQQATESDFVNDNPLIPTAELPKDESNYGKVTIAPPDGEELPNAKFLNLNNEEIDEEDKEEDNSTLLNMTPIMNTEDSSNQMIPEIVEEEKKEEKSAELDNLLSMGNPTAVTPNTTYITPAEKIVKQDSTTDLKNNSKSDYFNASDISEIHIPPQVMIENQEKKTEESVTTEESKAEVKEENNLSLDNIPIAPIEENPSEAAIKNVEPKDKIEAAKEKINNLIEELKASGLTITKDDMNFEKTYQVIIKINKDNE